MTEAKKHERASSLREVRIKWKEFGFTVRILRNSFAEGSKKL